MRMFWIVAGVLSCLLLGAVYIEYAARHPSVPPALEAKDCLTPSPPEETGNAWLIRLGGRVTRYPNAQWLGNSYTVPSIGQGRNLTKYERLELRDRAHFHPSEVSNPTLAQARIFLWGRWKGRKRAYLILTLSSVDHTGTSHIFVEPDDGGRWRVYQRLLDRHELIDEPTVYSVAWVTPKGWREPGSPLPAGQAPDPLNDELEFRDICGERAGGL